MSPFLDRLRMTKPKRVERWLSERDAEVSVYRSSEIRSMVTMTADTAGLGVGDHFVGFRRVVVTAGWRPRSRRSVTRISTQQQQQPDRYQHPASTPLPTRCRKLKDDRRPGRHFAKRHRPTRRRKSRWACADYNWLTGLRRADRLSPLTTRWLVQRTKKAVRADCIVTVTLSHQTSLNTPIIALVHLHTKLCSAIFEKKN